MNARQARWERILGHKARAGVKREETHPTYNGPQRRALLGCDQRKTS